VPPPVPQAVQCIWLAAAPFPARLVQPLGQLDVVCLPGEPVQVAFRNTQDHPLESFRHRIIMAKTLQGDVLRAQAQVMALLPKQAPDGYDFVPHLVHDHLVVPGALQSLAPGPELSFVLFQHPDAAEKVRRVGQEPPRGAERFSEAIEDRSHRGLFHKVAVAVARVKAILARSLPRAVPAVLASADGRWYGDSGAVSNEYKGKSDCR